jgi:hypothetical protein
MNVLEQIVARFRLRAAMRLAWLRHLAAAEQSALDRILSDADDPKAQARWLSHSKEGRACAEEVRTIEEQREAAGADHPVARLVQVFGLSAPESDLLEGAVAVAADPSLQHLLAALESRDDPRPLTVENAARVYGHGRTVLVCPESAVLRWEMVEIRETLGGSVVTPDPALVQFLAGRAALSQPLVDRGVLKPAPEPLPGWRIERAAKRVRRLLDARTRVRVVLTGPPGSGRRSFSSAVAERVGMTLLVVDSGSDETQWPRLNLHAQRHAFLYGCALAWTGAAALRAPAAGGPAGFPLQFLLCEEGEQPPPQSGGADLRAKVPRPRAEERAALWAQHLPSIATWSTGDRDRLARNYPLTPGEIAAASRRAPADSPRAVAASVRAVTRARLGDLAQVLSSSFEWDDLVLPAPLKEKLQDFLFEARHRGAFWEHDEARRLFPMGRGLIALLSGPPGTGKTMSAQVLAAALGLELHQLDLASVLDKYIGETAKHIRSFFAASRHKNAMLLCDEADALFARRSSEVRDAQDRFANADAAYLLQQVERYPGIVVLTTNQKGSIDPAFLRRIRYEMDFPRPAAPQRLAIWRKIAIALAGAATAASLDKDLEWLASTVDVTGAQIKTSVLAAIFIAGRRNQPLSMPHLLTAVDRELAKEGRALGSRERERMVRDAG